MYRVLPFITSPPPAIKNPSIDSRYTAVTFFPSRLFRYRYTSSHVGFSILFWRSSIRSIHPIIYPSLQHGYMFDCLLHWAFVFHHFLPLLYYFLVSTCTPSASRTTTVCSLFTQFRTYFHDII